jgi:hypothetical protein
LIAAIAVPDMHVHRLVESYDQLALGTGIIWVVVVVAVVLAA